MKSTRSLITILGLLLVGCASTLPTPQGVLKIPPEVRKNLTADETLFRDLLTKPGGVAHVDMLLYPRSKQKTLTRIEALTAYDSRQSGQERWFVGHESGETAAYLVKLIPDGRGGTTFTVQHEPAAPKKATQ